MKTGHCDIMGKKKVTVFPNFNEISVYTIKSTLNKTSRVRSQISIQSKGIELRSVGFSHCSVYLRIHSIKFYSAWACVGKGHA